MLSAGPRVWRSAIRNLVHSSGDEFGLHQFYETNADLKRLRLSEEGRADVDTLVVH